MMRRLRLVFPAMVLPILFAVVFFAQGEPNDFVIKNADESKYLSISGSSTLANLLENMGPRITVQYANEMQRSDLESIPAGLNNLLDLVQTRFIIQYANDNQILGTSYPKDMINDDQPPNAGNPVVSRLAGSSVEIAWTTNEFTSSTVEFGTQPGQFTKTIKDDSYKKQHNVTVSNLTPGVTYYFRTSNTDRSGNRSFGKEQTFEIAETIYQFLPMVRRN